MEHAPALLVIKGSHSFGLVIPDCELYWTHVQISAQAIEKASRE